MGWTTTHSSIALIAVPMSLLIQTVDNQTTVEIVDPTTTPFEFTTMNAENLSALELNLDDVLAAVNQTDNLEILAPIPPPEATTYGDRAYMAPLNYSIKQEDLMGRTLRIVVPKIEPPYVNYVNFTEAERLARGYGPGAVIEILIEMMHNLNLTYEIVETNETEWGHLDNGNWTGIFGLLNQGKVDIIAGAAIMQFDRSLISDLTFPFQYAPTAMLIKQPEKFTDNTWLIVTQPFSWEVWGLTAISIAVSGVILFLFTRFLYCANEVQYTFVESLWVFFSIFVQQGLPVQPRSWSCRVMLALWWLASITLMATFTGSLVALFAVDKTTLPFNNIQQLVKQVQRGKWRIVMDATTITRTSMIRESESPVYKTLWYEMSVNRKVTYVKNINDAISTVLGTQNNVLLGPEDSLKYYATIDCRLYKLEEGILPTYLSIPLAKDSEYSTYLSNLVRDLVERGFVQKWINDYTSYMAAKKSNTKCATTDSASDKYLDLSKSQGAFWVLIAGISLGITFLVIEFGWVAIRFFFKFFQDKQDGGKTFPMDNIARGSKNSNTTSSMSSGGEPPIVKLDRQQIDNYQREAIENIGRQMSYQGTRF